MNEVFPVAAGLVVGALLALIAPRLRLRIGALAAVVLGVTATVISGEYTVGWEYLLVDIPLVAISSVFALVAVRRLRRASAPGSPSVSGSSGT
jgi:membrane protein implicated in regulation of membrane protease activity